MARKRGGLAGVWDRNKGVITPVAEMLAGAVNPLLGAGVGAAIGAFDRPGEHVFGKGGVGMDIGNSAKGALTGYGMGKMGQSARTGLQGLFTGGANAASKGVAPQLAGGVGQDVMGSVPTIGPGASTDMSAMLNAAPKAPPVFTGSNLQTATSALSSNPFPSAQQLSGIGGGAGSTMNAVGSKLGSMFTGKNAPIGAEVLRGTMGAISGRGEQGILQQRADLEQQKFEYERQMQDEERKRKERIAQLLMPMFQQMQAGQKNPVFPQG
jgi:hypothetical protein